jgi:hypothetical protein
MWPWGHLAVGYLCYVVSLRVRGTGERTLTALAAVAVGTQFPDLVDKPLAWTFAILPSGRSLAHSLITATLVLGVLYWVAKRRGSGEEETVAFGVGYVSHSLADLGPDVVFGLLRGDWSQLEWTTYLLWPLLPSPPYPRDDSFLEHFADFTLSPYVLFQFVLLGLVVGVGVWEWRWAGRRGE